MFSKWMVACTVVFLVLSSPVLADDMAPGTVFTDCDGCPEMVVVPAGSFLMGSPDDEPGRDDDEGPQHEVTIGYEFAVGRYEVTVAQYRQFIEESHHRMKVICGRQERLYGYPDSSGRSGPGRTYIWTSPGFSQNDDYPVVCVDRLDAFAFVEWLSERTGQIYRLLSEAEWEYAARAGTKSTYHWGDEAVHDLANYVWTDGPNRWHVETKPVGSFPSNQFGLFDLAGNAEEWVADCYHDEYEGAPSDGSAWFEEDCDWHVVRGGSFDRGALWIRSSERLVRHETGRRRNTPIGHTGFRVARDLD